MSEPGTVQIYCHCVSLLLLHKPTDLNVNLLLLLHKPTVIIYTETVITEKPLRIMKQQKKQKS